jgi:superfamily II DNA/RNA helicase
LLIIAAELAVSPSHNIFFTEMLSEAVKLLKGEYCVRAIRELKMDRAIIFCRTKVDCDKLEMYLESIGTGFNQVPLVSFILDRISWIP